MKSFLYCSTNFLLRNKGVGRFSAFLMPATTCICSCLLVLLLRRMLRRSDVIITYYAKQKRKTRNNKKKRRQILLALGSSRSAVDFSAISGEEYQLFNPRSLVTRSIRSCLNMPLRFLCPSQHLRHPIIHVFSLLAK